MHDKHIMIDLETLSVQSDAAIIAIGVVEFSLDKILVEKLWRISPMLASGRRDDPTLTWWEEQKSELKCEIFGGTDRETTVLLQFARFMENYSESHWIWAGPSTFDLAILKNRYREIGIEYPINWYNERDQSTLSSMAKHLKIDYSGAEFGGRQPHNPLHDSIFQAHKVQIILKMMAYQFDTRKDDAAKGAPVFGDMSGGT